MKIEFRRRINNEIEEKNMKTGSHGYDSNTKSLKSPESSRAPIYGHLV